MIANQSFRCGLVNNGLNSKRVKVLFGVLKDHRGGSTKNKGGQ